MPEEKLSRKEREYLYHRKEILNTALKLFSEKGFHNVSMNEIARESEFAVGTLYKFFENKEDLYKSLIIEKAEEFHSALIEALEKEGDELERIRSCIDAKIEVFLKNLDFARLYLTETQGACFSVKAGLDEELKRHYEDYVSRLSDVFMSGIKKGVFKKFDPYLLALALNGITNSFLFEYLENPETHRFNTDLIMRIFLEGILMERNYV